MKIYKVWAKEVAKELLKPNKERMEKLSAEIAKVVSDSAKAAMPDPLREAHEKYPSAIACINYRYARDSRANVMIHFFPPCPDPAKFGMTMELVLALSKLKAEFPEAYRAFQELQEKRRQNRPPEQLANCDAVEKLRAELSKRKQADKPDL